MAALPAADSAQTAPPAGAAPAPADGHVYLDYFSAMTDEKGFLRTEMSADDLHPNARDYAIMGPLAEAAIAKALSSK